MEEKNKVSIWLGNFDKSVFVQLLDHVLGCITEDISLGE